MREQIRANIVSGKWEYGKELPSELKLCESLKLSRATVRQAMDELIRDGLIERKRGKGTFVIYQNKGFNMFSDPSLTRQMQNVGVSIHSRVLSAGEGSLDRDAAGYFEEGQDDFCKIRRVRYIENIPTIIEENSISKKWAKELLKQNLNTISVYDYLEQANGIKFDSYHIEVKAVPLSTEDKQLLGLEDDRVQLIIMKRDIVGIRFDIITRYRGEVVMFNRRVADAKNISILADYDANSHQFSITSGKILISTDG